MFYNLENDLGNGCDTCDTVPQNMMPPAMNNGSCGPLTNVQVNAGQQPFNPYAVNPAQPPVQVAPQAPPQQVVNVDTGAATNMDASAQQVAVQYNNEPVMVAPDFVNTVEGFRDPSLRGDVGKMLTLTVLTIVAALAINECMKYYLNKGIQSTEGTSYHYLAYVVVAIVLVVITTRYIKLF